MNRKLLTVGGVSPTGTGSGIKVGADGNLQVTTVAPAPDMFIGRVLEPMEVGETGVQAVFGIRMRAQGYAGASSVIGMCAAGGYLYITTSDVVRKFTPNLELIWEIPLRVDFVSVINGFLYAIRHNKLFKINATTGKFDDTGNFNGSEGLTYTDNPEPFGGSVRAKDYKANSVITETPNGDLFINTREVICLYTSSGTKVWEHPKGAIPVKNSAFTGVTSEAAGPSTNVIFHDDKIIYGNVSRGTIAAVNIVDGELEAYVSTKRSTVSHIGIHNESIYYRRSMLKGETSLADFYNNSVTWANTGDAMSSADVGIHVGGGYFVGMDKSDRNIFFEDAAEGRTIYNVAIDQVIGASMKFDSDMFGNTFIVSSGGTIIVIDQDLSIRGYEFKR